MKVTQFFEQQPQQKTNSHNILERTTCVQLCQLIISDHQYTLYNINFINSIQNLHVALFFKRCIAENPRFSVNYWLLKNKPKSNFAFLAAYNAYDQCFSIMLGVAYNERKHTIHTTCSIQQTCTLTRIQKNYKSLKSSLIRPLKDYQ